MNAETPFGTGRYAAAHRLLRSGQLKAAVVLIRDLTDLHPEFVEYYLSLVLSGVSLPDDLLRRARSHLSPSDMARLDQLIQDPLAAQGHTNPGPLKLSFCIAVKNRSQVQVLWNGITRKRTFVTSYRDSPRQFTLLLLKNLVDSIAEATLPGITYEIVIADFGSTDDHPRNWLREKLPSAIETRVVDVAEDFSRGRGLNVASDHASGDIAFFLDADMLVSADLIRQAMDICLVEDKAFFPICFSYLTPFHKEGWQRKEGWGNLAISRQLQARLGVRWWEKKSWGSEDDHMRDQLEGHFVRDEGRGFFHQWHPEEDFKTQNYKHTHNRLKVVIGVTTYNRLDYLREFVESWDRTRNRYYDWTLIVSDDGSSDGTLAYLEALQIEDVTVHVVKHNRVGVHESTNSIIDRCVFLDFDYAFKCDDDVIFKAPGWDDAYIDAMAEHPYLCNYNTSWRPAKPIRTSAKCVAYANAYYSQGALWTFTKAVIAKVGWFDTRVFGYKGYGHIDYSVRAARAGFNELSSLYDLKGSDAYITLQAENYKPAISAGSMKQEFGLVVDEDQKERMKRLILEERQAVVHVPRTSIYDYAQSTKKPRLHLLIHNNHLGGAEYIHFCHALALRPVCREILVWSIGQGHYFNRFVAQGFTVRHVPGLLDESSADWRSFTRAVEDGDFIYNANAYVDRQVFEFSRTKFVYHHAILHSDTRWIIEHHNKHRFFTHRFLTIHRHIRDALVAADVSSDRIKVVPNALEPGFPHGKDHHLGLQVRQALGIPDSALVVGFVGRIAKDKNALDLLRIAEQVTMSRHDIYFVVVGGAPATQEGEAYAAEFQCLLSRVTHRQRVIHVSELLGSKLTDLLNGFDAAVNVSPSEGLPVALLEQLAKGLHCVYPAFPAIADLLNQVPSTLVAIGQRKEKMNLSYTNEEIGSFVEALVRLDKSAIAAHAAQIEAHALENFRFDRMATDVRLAFLDRARLALLLREEGQDPRH